MDKRPAALTRTFVDKSTWGAGPWQQEPDEVRWTDPTSGLSCLIIRSPEAGHLLGYVGVREGHPLYGASYALAREYGVIDVHGNLTWSGVFDEEDHGIWWFGFDCAHATDVLPGYEELYQSLQSRLASVFGVAAHLPRRKYRRMAYVKREVRRLAGVLKADA